jgi:hypothetical protein
MTDLEQLALRCEGASEGSRELDFLIAEVFHVETVAELSVSEPIEPIRWREVVKRHSEYPAYTASLDAAMSLVPDDWHLMLIGVNDSWHAMLTHTPSASLGETTSLGRTAPTVITAASLRARARQTRQPQEGTNNDEQ